MRKSPAAQAGRNPADVAGMDVPRRPGGIALLAGLLLAAGGCDVPEDRWPPPPRDRWEKRLIEAARRQVDQYDGWGEVAWVVERHEGKWRVQAWQIVNPQNKGRMRCVPWAVRGLIFDNDANLVAYRNYL